MKLKFLGTRGGIIARSNAHHMHSVLLISYYKTNIIIDWGTDWLKKPFPPKISAILITHAHPDHVGGLANGAPYPVYASKDTFDRIKQYPLKNKVEVHNQKSFKIGSLLIEPFKVNHSINAPAIGYRITAGKKTIFYVPDLVSIVNEKQALKRIDLYIGDGAIITRTMLVRKKDYEITGHAPISIQLSWCQKYGIAKVIFTHCGSEIVKGKAEAINSKINDLAKKYDVKTTIAQDNLELQV